jgi:DNA-binding MarR family transcriptional regulator
LAGDARPWNTLKGLGKLSANKIMADERSVHRKALRKAAALRVLPCACANLRRASRAVTQLYDAQLRPTGLTIAQFTLLQTISLTGQVTQSRLGQILVLDSTTLSRTLRLLERKRWIRRLRSGTDRRERQITLTRAGRALFKAAVPLWNRAQKLLLARLGRQRWKALLRELSAIAELSRQD